MNVYFLSRWGNGEDEFGADAFQETNMIVRALDINKASEIADPYLKRLPQKTESGRLVAMFTQSAVQIGSTSEEKEIEGVICPPWYGGALPQNCIHSWKRDNLKDGWITYEEYYGEKPYFNEPT